MAFFHFRPITWRSAADISPQMRVGLSILAEISSGVITWGSDSACHFTPLDVNRCTAIRDRPAGKSTSMGFSEGDWASAM